MLLADFLAPSHDRVIILLPISAASEELASS